MALLHRTTTKRTLTILLGLALLLFVSAACAESTIIDGAAAEAILAAHPGCIIAAQSQWGGTAAAVVTADAQRILCVAEKQNGRWTVTIDNPSALRQWGDLPSLLMDTDTVLYWRYRDNDNFTEYRSEKANGVWGTVALRHLNTFANGSGVESLIAYGPTVHGKVITKTICVQDENENLLYTATDIPIPAESLAPYASLASFDTEKFPGNFIYIQDWTNTFIRQSAAEQLMPDYTFLGGTLNSGSFEFLMQKPDGSKVFAGVNYNDTQGWVVTESTPLPADTVYGCENFTSSLCFPNKLLVNMNLFANGVWGVSYIYSFPEDGTPKEMIFLGQNWIADNTWLPQTRYYGSHPWSDITAIDWGALPLHLQDAVQKIDPAGWAVVNNPNPADRLHLRVKPDQSAVSLGKYYNGTAVQVLQSGDTWDKVSVLGVQGYMMKKYLVYGQAMNSVSPASLYYTTKSYTASLYRHPQDAKPFATVTTNDFGLCIMGIAGEEWYHVWFAGSGLSGYIRQTDLWPGNG